MRVSRPRNARPVSKRELLLDRAFQSNHSRHWSRVPALTAALALIAGGAVAFRLLAPTPVTAPSGAAILPLAPLSSPPRASTQATTNTVAPPTPLTPSSGSRPLPTFTGPVSAYQPLPAPTPSTPPQNSPAPKPDPWSVLHPSSPNR